MNNHSEMLFFYEKIQSRVHFLTGGAVTVAVKFIEGILVILVSWPKVDVHQLVLKYAVKRIEPIKLIPFHISELIAVPNTAITAFGNNLEL